MDENSPLTEWLLKMRKQLSEVEQQEYEDYVDEELSKYQRLEKLHELIGLPIRESSAFDSTDFKFHSERLQVFFKSNKKTGKYNIRAEPLQKFKRFLATRRKVGISEEDCYKFITDLSDDDSKYSIRLLEYDEPEYSGLMIVNTQGIFLEMVKGSLSSLNQGWVDDINEFYHAIMIFPQTKKLSFFFKESYPKKIAIKAITAVKAPKCMESLGYKTVNGYLFGHYDFMYYGDWGLRFNDYNTSAFRTNMNLIQINLSCQPITLLSNGVRGLTACPGKVEGKARIIRNQDDIQKVREGDIIVTDMTSVGIVSIIKRIKGIITNKGGILCHAATICREFRKACIVGTGCATSIFKDDEDIILDATGGEARKANANKL